MGPPRVLPSSGPARTLSPSTPNYAEGNTSAAYSRHVVKDPGEFDAGKGRSLRDGKFRITVASAFGGQSNKAQRDGPPWLRDADKAPRGLALDVSGMEKSLAASIYLACLTDDAKELKKLLEATKAPKEAPKKKKKGALPPVKRQDSIFTSSKNITAPGGPWRIVDRYGSEPLALCARLGHTAAAQLLLEAGVESEAKNVYCGRTALHRACEAGKQEMLELLLKHKANPNAISADGQNALHLAASNGHIEVMKLLLKHKTAANWRDLGGRTPLMAAAAAAQKEACLLLTSKGGAQWEDKDPSGWTALLHAVYSPRSTALETAQACVAKKASVDVASIGGRTLQTLNPQMALALGIGVPGAVSGADAAALLDGDEDDEQVEAAAQDGE